MANELTKIALHTLLQIVAVFGVLPADEHPVLTVSAGGSWLHAQHLVALPLLTVVQRHRDADQRHVRQQRVLMQRLQLHGRLSTCRGRDRVELKSAFHCDNWVPVQAQTSTSELHKKNQETPETDAAEKRI